MRSKGNNKSVYLGELARLMSREGVVSVNGRWREFMVGNK
jgi:hypothetical protein